MRTYANVRLVNFPTSNKEQHTFLSFSMVSLQDSPSEDIEFLNQI